jgi:hypothetical protein
VCPIERRQKRNARRSARRYRTTERDWWILETIGKLRFTTTGQLARLHFKSRWAANKRLRKLLDAGLVRAWVRSLSEENIYSLDRGGLRLLKDSNAGDGWTTPRGLDRNLDHLLAVNRVRVSLATALPEAGGEIIWWRSDWELRTGARDQLVPDALFQVRWEDGKAVTFSLELDNGSRSPKKFLSKMLAYTRLRQSQTLSGIGEAIILVVCRDAREHDRYRESVGAAGLGVRVWFATLEGVERGAAEAIWSSPKNGGKRSLRALGTCPYGKDGSGRECVRMARG